MYDLIIIGGGPAGYYAAERAGEAGLSTLLIEERFLGGVCLNEGCIPSKTLLNSAKILGIAKTAEKYGVSISDAKLDFAKVMARKQKVVETLRNGVAFTLKKCKVTVVQARAMILPKKDGVFQVQTNDTVAEGKRLLVATGSQSIRLPVPGADQPFVVTNRELLSIDTLPKNLAVVGGGVIGLELASFFAEAGSNVSVIELLPGIAGALDTEIALLLKKELEKIGITFYMQSRVTAIGDHTVTFETQGTETTIPADITLMSVGRKPVLHDIGLENIGVDTTKRALPTDEHGRTGIADVWAAGDINGVSMLAHTAYREAQICIDDILGKDTRMTYHAIPSVIYTHPEVACVGLTRDEAEKKGMAVTTAKLPMSFNGRYIAENEGGRGVCKVVVDTASQTLLGVHMIGASCSEMIFGAAAMVERRMKIDDIRTIVFPHPTVSEIIKDTLMHLSTTIK